MQSLLFPAKRRIFHWACSASLKCSSELEAQLQFFYVILSSAVPVFLERHLTGLSILKSFSTRNHNSNTNRSHGARHDRRDRRGRQITLINQPIPPTTNLHLKHLVLAPFQPYHNPHNPPHASAA
ncbi:hypothetical protein P167DRAFT_173636 [Morchella conica CCBAS932]|uniref:Uncharacterized protein n=1 Tax=Morchella conica CCBAS932 TaxID=1392247 RepID=A0A3N4KN66_9PEZI|nr:hypothetical protein P167DRAFT_173636 [Morchella conica CCBAS932]